MTHDTDRIAALEAEVSRLRARDQRLTMALIFARWVVKSGEPFTEEFDRITSFALNEQEAT